MSVCTSTDPPETERDQRMRNADYCEVSHGLAKATEEEEEEWSHCRLYSFAFNPSLRVKRGPGSADTSSHQVIDSETHQPPSPQLITNVGQA